MATTSWADALADWRIQLIDEEKSPLTLSNYACDLTHFAAWFRTTYETEPVLDMLGPTVIREWKQYQVDVRKHAPASVNRRIATIRSFLRWANSTGLIAEFRMPRSVRQVTPPPRWLSKKEQLSLMRAVERTKDRRTIGIITVLIHTGLRIAELTNLTWAQVTITPRKGEVTVVGKGRKTRTVPLNSDARRALEMLHAMAGDKPRVLYGQRGPLKERGIQRMVEAVGITAKLKDFSSHVCRHTFCWNLAQAGVRLEQIAALAGHESLDTTRRYVEPGQEELAAAVERLAGGED